MAGNGKATTLINFATKASFVIITKPSVHDVNYDDVVRDFVHCFWCLIRLHLRGGSLPCQECNGRRLCGRETFSGFEEAAGHV